MKTYFNEKDQTPFAVGNFDEVQTREGRDLQIGTKIYRIHERTLRTEGASVGGGVSAVMPLEYVCLAYPIFDTSSNQPIPAPTWV